MRTDSLKKRYVIKLLANIVAGIINAIFIAIVPKALGPLAYGQFNFLLQFYNQLIAFLDASTSTAFFTKLSANNSRNELIAFYTFYSFFLLLFITSFIYIVDFLGYSEIMFSGISSQYIFLGILFGFLTWLTQIYIKVSDAFALTVSVELVKIIHKLLMLLAIVCLVSSINLDLKLYFYFQLISLLVFIIVLTILFIKKGVVTLSIFSNNINYKYIMKEFYDFCSPLFIFNITAIAIGLFDIWLLQSVSGSIQTGFYGLAYSVAAMCFLFTSAMTPIITREFSKSFELNDIENVKQLFERYVPMLYAISAFFSVFIAFNAKELLLIFTDSRYAGAYLVLVIMAFYPLHQTYGQINSAVFFASEETIKYRNIGLVFSIIGLIFSFIFIYLLELGALGFACKMVITQLLSVNVQLYVNVKKLGVGIKKFLWHQILTILVFCLIAFFVREYLPSNESVLFSFIISGLIYSLLIFICFIISPELFGLKRKDLHKLNYLLKSN